MCLDVPVDCVAQKDRFLDNVLYISGFIIHKMIEKKNEPSVEVVHLLRDIIYFSL